MLILNFDEDDSPAMPPLQDKEELKLEPEETIAERVKLNLRKNNRKRIKNFDSKQVISKTSNIISTNKIRKQFIQIKK